MADTLPNVSDNIRDPEPSTTLLEGVVKDLQILIADTLQPGSQLPTEAELADRFGVSRATLREALKVLAGTGVLDMGRGRKTVVREPTSAVMAGQLSMIVRRDPRRVLELTEIQDSLHNLVATLATRYGRMHLDKLALAEGYLDDMAKADSRESFSRANAGFHRALADSTENKLLAYVLDAIEQTLDEVADTGFESQLTPLRPGGPEGALEVHRAILEAVHSENQQLAAKAMRAHAQEMRRGVRSRIRALVSQRP